MAIPLWDMAILVLIVATPYAGITQVRFKGYNLSLIRHPADTNLLQ